MAARGGTHIHNPSPWDQGKMNDGCGDGPEGMHEESGQCNMSRVAGIGERALGPHGVPLLV